ncbi:hypothetical protein E3N88_38455 [Mikania micrantha]|uniref:Uncharacterized protein n=1 Tax=Mikania micrantha TaxID=192012 RepID=A0A5N6LU13_9ASTR|nr:hypothetical protein E3N88_38455 [Mikania micrantha]
MGLGQGRQRLHIVAHDDGCTPLLMARSTKVGAALEVNGDGGEVDDKTQKSNKKVPEEATFTGGRLHRESHSEEKNVWFDRVRRMELGDNEGQESTSDKFLLFLLLEECCKIID